MQSMALGITAVQLCVAHGAVGVLMQSMALDVVPCSLAWLTVLSVCSCSRWHSMSLPCSFAWLTGRREMAYHGGQGSCYPAHARCAHGLRTWQAIPRAGAPTLAEREGPRAESCSPSGNSAGPHPLETALPWHSTHRTQLGDCLAHPLCCEAPIIHNGSETALLAPERLTFGDCPAPFLRSTAPIVSNSSNTALMAPDTHEQMALSWSQPCSATAYRIVFPPSWSVSEGNQSQSRRGLGFCTGQ